MNRWGLNSAEEAANEVVAPAEEGVANGRGRSLGLKSGWPPILLAALWAPLQFAMEPDASLVPDNYVLNYPTAQQCCPPIRSTFAEATQSYLLVRGHRFHQQQNGGYGLPIIDKVDGQNLLHSLSKEGWEDPVAFLRRRQADTNPAPFRSAK